MAIGNPTQVGFNDPAGSATSVATSSACVIPANSLVVAIVVLDNNGAAMGQPATVSDGTNNYSLAFGASSAPNCYISYWYFYDTAGRTATITASNFNGTNQSIAFRRIRVFTISNAASVSPVDQTGSSGGFNQTTSALTTSGNIAQADEVSFVTVCWFGTPTLTGFPSTGYSSLAQVSSGIEYIIQYKNGLTSGAHETPSAITWTGNATNTTTVVTFKGATSSAFVPKILSFG